MSHPIDKYFKQQLGSLASSQGLEEDWQGAQELLGLQKKKRKRFFWIWLIVPIILVSSFFYLNKADSDEQGSEIIIDQSNSTNPIKSIATLGDNQVSRNLVDNTQNQTISAPHSDLLENVLPNGDSGLDGNSYMPNKSAKNSAISKKETPDDSFVQQEMRRVIGANGLNNQLEKKNDPIVTLKEAITLKSKEEVPRINNDISALALIRREISTPIYAEILGKEQQTLSIQMGLYSSYQLIEKAPSIGMFGQFRMNRNISFDFGIGLKRTEEKNAETSDNVALDMQRNILGELSSTNSYTYYSLELPIQVNYYKDKLFGFTGLLIERPISLSGSQIVTLQPELMDVAGAPSNMDPLIELSSEPITTSLTYSLSSVPDLQNFFFYGRVGLGYEVTNALRVSSQLQYRFSDKSTISPLVDDVEISKRKLSAWDIGLRLDYHF